MLESVLTSPCSSLTLSSFGLILLLCFEYSGYFQSTTANGDDAEIFCYQLIRLVLVLRHPGRLDSKY